MHELIFRNWKFALLWAIGLTASAAAFFEKDGGQAQLQRSAEQIRAQREQLGAPPPPAAMPSDSTDPDAVQDEGAAADPVDAPADPAAGGDAPA